MRSFVITSYSIHYTKLYDRQGEARALQQGGRIGELDEGRDAGRRPAAGRDLRLEQRVYAFEYVDVIAVSCFNHAVCGMVSGMVRCAVADERTVWIRRGLTDSYNFV